MIGWLIRRAADAAVWAYFRRIDGDGLEHLPAKGALILASNHTNALVDPLVIQFVSPRRLTMTAKASLAGNAYVGFLLWAFDAIRFQRPAESGIRAAAAANRAAIEACRERLARGEALCVFPEGKSHSEPAMLPFKLGVARIALAHEGPVAIVPVGLYYERKERFRSAVAVRFGPPLDPHQQPWSAAELTREIRRRIEGLTAHFEHRREAILADWLGHMLASEGAPPPALRDETPVTEHARRLQRIADRLEQLRPACGPELTALETRVAAYRQELLRLGVTPEEVYLRVHWGRALHFVIGELEILLVGGVIAAWGWLVHLLPFLVVRTITYRFSRERDQWASNAICPAIVVYPFFYVLQMVAAWLLLPVPWALVFTLSLPFSGLYYVLWRDRAGGAWRRARTFVRWCLDRGLQSRLASDGRALTQDVLALAERSSD